LKNQTSKNEGESPPYFLDRKIITDGGSRVLRFSKFIPPNWEYVRIHYEGKKDNFIYLKLEKLLGENNHTHTATTNPKHKQNP